MSNGTPNWPPPPTTQSLKDEKRKLALENHPDVTMHLSDEERKVRDEHFIKEMREIEDTEKWLESDEGEVRPETMRITKEGTALAEVRNRLNIAPKEEVVSAGVPIVPETLQEEPAPEEQVRSANLEFVEVVQTNQETGPERRNEALRITHESAPTPEEGAPAQEEDVILEEIVPEERNTSDGHSAKHDHGPKRPAFKLLNPFSWIANGLWLAGAGFRLMRRTLLSPKWLGATLVGIIGTAVHYAGHAWKHKPDFDMGEVGELMSSSSIKSHGGGGSHKAKASAKGGGGHH